MMRSKATKGLVAKRTKMFEGDRDKLDHIFKEYRHICREDRSDIKIDENSTAPVNIEKNRYPDVLVIKNTAVKLEEIQGIKGSDYINANFVKDVTNSKRKQLYICCQAPLSSTFNDFWRMAWEQHIPAIVMITNLVEKNRVKADPYWPTRVGETMRYGNICVKLSREQTRGSNITVRTLKMWQSQNAVVINKDDESVTPIVSDDEEVDIDDSLSGTDDICTISDEGSSEDTDLQPTEDQEVRKIFQIHCTEWPDFGVPKSTQVMKDLVAEVDIRKKSLDDPIVVHCSAGIGRTGTFVAIHMSLQKDLHGEEIDIKDTVRHLRSQRLGMVQSKEQYMFVYSVVADMVRERKENSLGEERRRTCTPNMFKQMMKEALEIWEKEDEGEFLPSFSHSHPSKPTLKRVWTSDNRTEDDLVPPYSNKTYKSDGENTKKERKKILHKEENAVIKQKSHPQLRVSAVRKKLIVSTYVNDEEQILKIQAIAPVENTAKNQKKFNPT